MAKVQDKWYWCHKCQGLFFGGHATAGTCPKGNEHKKGAVNYELFTESVPQWSGQLALVS